MDKSKILKQLFTLNYMNTYKDIGNALKRDFSGRQKCMTI